MSKQALLTLSTLLALTASGCSGEGIVVFGLGLGIVGVIISIILSVLFVVLVIWAVVDIIRKPYPASKKLLWAIIIILIPYIGAIIYLLLERNNTESRI